MLSKTVQWVNTSVLVEAIMRYEEGRLPLSLRLWVEKLLDIKSHKGSIYPEERLLPRK